MGRGREDQLKKKRAIHEIRRYKCHDNDNYHTLDQRWLSKVFRLRTANSRLKKAYAQESVPPTKLFPYGKMRTGRRDPDSETCAIGMFGVLWAREEIPPKWPLFWDLLDFNIICFFFIVTSAGHYFFLGSQYFESACNTSLEVCSPSRRGQSGVGNTWILCICLISLLCPVLMLTTMLRPLRSRVQ